MNASNAQTETYEDVKMMVHKVTHDFLRWKGISEAFYEEWHAEACLAFSLAYNNFDRHRSGFSTWLWHSIWNNLSNKLRKEAFDFKMRGLNGRDRHVLDHRRTNAWSAEDFLSSLSEDARTVASLTLSGTATWDGKRAEDVRELLYDLLTRLGWSYARVVESFMEIREALRQ